MAETREPRTVVEKVDEFFRTLESITAAEDAVKALKERRDKLQLDIIDSLDGQGMTQVKDTAGRMVFLKEPRFYASINKENEKEATEFLKRNLKLGYLFKEQVSASALGRIVKERLTKGLAVPEKFVTYYAKKEIGYRNGKAESGND